MKKYFFDNKVTYLDLTSCHLNGVQAVYLLFRSKDNSTFIIHFNPANPPIITDLNLDWSYREVFEFFNCQLNDLTDNRNLLLDYGNLDNPLLKTFYCEGTKDMFFDFSVAKPLYKQINQVQL